MALVAGASEGIGAAFCRRLAAGGMDLVLVARRKEPLHQLASSLTAAYAIKTITLCQDLSERDAAQNIKDALRDRDVSMVVYNAAMSFIGPFEKDSLEHNNRIAFANMITPMNMLHLFGESMLTKGKGAMILMASLAGFQGSGYLAAYAATKAFIRVLAESLWYEWNHRGVDVIACCAGATATDNYRRTNPGKSSVFAPRVQSPEEVVEDCLEKLGKKPSFIAGTGNKVAGFFMQRMLTRATAIRIMSDTTRKIYRL